MNGHKDVLLLLIQKGANIDCVNKVSVHILILYHKQFITENKRGNFLFLKENHFVLYKYLIFLNIMLYNNYNIIESSYHNLIKSDKCCFNGLYINYFPSNVNGDQEIVKCLIYDNYFNDRLRSTYKCRSKAHIVKKYLF